jgi:hypothetical protein
LSNDFDNDLPFAILAAWLAGDGSLMTKLTLGASARRFSQMASYIHAGSPRFPVQNNVSA